jgi:hypothetical protein
MMTRRASTERRGHWLVPMAISLLMSTLCFLPPAAATGQIRLDTPDKVTGAIERVKQGDTGLLEKIVEARATRAVPILKEQFTKSQDPDAKAHIASVLIRLGEKDTLYWDYVVQQAAGAVKSDPPLPTMYDSGGKVMRGQTSPEFSAWVKAHDVSAEAASEDAAFVIPAKVYYLAATRDPRGVPLLRQALQSRNVLIAAVAAKGLAAAGDNESIPLIIEACKRAPSDSAVAIAESLIFFDDVRAQDAADLYLPKELAASLREGRTRGLQPFGK